MYSYTLSEIANLDEELDLFTEDEWNFSKVTVHDTNYQFFDDTYDLEFRKTNAIDILKVLLVILAVVLVLIYIVILYRKLSYIEDDNSASALANVLTVEQKTLSLDRIKGVESTSETTIEISKTLSRYFTILKTKDSLSSLDALCVSESHFSSAYNSYVHSMEYAYDTYDCYARILREVASCYSINRVNTVIEKDGVYYCYVELNAPSSNDINNYVYGYSYNFTKHFNSVDINEANIVRYVLDLTEISNIPCSTSEYCIEMVKCQDGVYRIKDDSALAIKCIGTYSLIVNSISKILGGSSISDSLSVS